MTQNEFEDLTGCHIHAFISGQVAREIEVESDTAEALLAAISQAVDEDGEPVIVFEWWTVSEDFAIRAEQIGEVIVDTPFGIAWGRQTTGFALQYDSIVCSILQRI